MSSSNAEILDAAEVAVYNLETHHLADRDLFWEGVFYAATEKCFQNNPATFDALIINELQAYASVDDARSIAAFCDKIIRERVGEERVPDNGNN